MSRTDLREYFCGRDAQWVYEDGRPFSAEEVARIDQMFSHCGCGGTFYPDGHKRARIRCPECRSSDVIRGDLEALVD